MSSPRTTEDATHGVENLALNRAAPSPSWNALVAFPGQPGGLLKGLGAVVRGLSVLVWALPLALAIIVWTVSRVGSSMPTPFSNLLLSLGVAPSLGVTALMWFGAWQVGRFQPAIPGWQRCMDRARGLGLLLIGFSPFLYWWSRRPDILYFKISAAALILFGLLFMAQLNAVLRRLTAMLPDQALREETASMAKLNYALLAILGALQVVFFAFDRATFDTLTTWVSRQYLAFSQLLVLLFMVIPIAITIALMWKIKETILEGVFSIGPS
jgi:hypothetical protein